MKNYLMNVNRFGWLWEILIICGFAVIPLFINLPYRAYIYLSWEGAYRLSEGQIPFRDFGLPLGGMYWVIPAIFFKLLGPQVITLVKAQVFINILSGLAVSSILRTLKIAPVIRIAGVYLFCLSFSFLNFWPWYNHTVIVYGLIATAITLKAIFATDGKWQYVFSLIAALFTFFSFFTKQDGGGLVFLLNIVLLSYDGWLKRKWISLIVYIGGFALLVFAAVLIFNRYHFSYWFNYGQPPHSARISISEMINFFLKNSIWLKFYFLVIIVIAAVRINGVTWNRFVRDKRAMVHLLFTLGILVMAAIIQVTSYVPSTINLFFHTFAFAYILQNLVGLVNINSVKQEFLWVSGLLLGITLWWSQYPWVYFDRLFPKEVDKGVEVHSPTGENMVGINNFILKTKSHGLAQSQWISSDIYSLKGIRLPKLTIDGIKRLLNSDLVKQHKELKVLNMSELTFLAYEIPYLPECNAELPLWHHLGVGMFNRQLELYLKRIEANYYDLVLFENIPKLNNFFPFAVRRALEKDYIRIDEFPAPRSGDDRQGTIEIYTNNSSLGQD